MPKNKNAIIRYKTIDSCLKNNLRKWTLNDIIEACSDALYNYDGVTTIVSKRTIQADFQFMRSDAGYSAPIIVEQRKYYTYENKDFSITNSPLNDTDIELLNDAVGILKQLQGFKNLGDLRGVVKKLENKIYSQKTGEKTIIDFDTNENLKGLEYMDVLYKAILNKQVLKVFYYPFKYPESRPGIFHPYLLKEFNNRWFVVGFIKGKEIPVVFALDRITKIEIMDNISFFEKENFDVVDFFKDTIGVTVLPYKPKNIKIKLKHQWAPYVITKPLHHSQKIVEETDKYTIIEVRLHPNKEFQSRILAMGDNATIVSPYQLRKYFKKMLMKNLKEYDSL